MDLVRLFSTLSRGPLQLKQNGPRQHRLGLRDAVARHHALHKWPGSRPRPRRMRMTHSQTPLSRRKNPPKKSRYPPGLEGRNNGFVLATRACRRCVAQTGACDETAEHTNPRGSMSTIPEGEGARAGASAPPASFVGAQPKAISDSPAPRREPYAGRDESVHEHLHVSARPKKNTLSDAGRETPFSRSP